MKGCLIVLNSFSERGFERGYWRGYVRLNPDLNNLYEEESGADIYVPSDYPLSIPEIYLDGITEMYSHEKDSSWSSDSIVLVRKDKVIVYTQSESGEKPMNEHFCDCVDDIEYTVTEYDLKTAKKKKYKMILEGTAKFELVDYFRLHHFVESESLREFHDYCFFTI